MKRKGRVKEGKRRRERRQTERRESISSTKTIDGCTACATVNSALTNFSPSPTHLLVSVDAERAKKQQFACSESARHIRVLPVPGGLKDIYRESEGGSVWR